MASPPLPSPTTAQWLLGDEAATVLADIADATLSPAAIEKLRKQLGGPDAAPRAAAAFELAELRHRATNKFTRAAEMFFTRKALEQSTDEWIARYKAQRLSAHQTLVDACCGLGGDLVGNLTGRPKGVDSDPLLAAYAGRNAEVYGVEATISTTTLAADNLPECDAWHADPDRRVGGRRSSQPDLHEPTLATLAAWRRRTPAAAIKLAPAAQLPDDWQAECELEWISRAGECRQLVAWAGPLAHDPGQRRATKVHSDGTAATFLGDSNAACGLAGQLGAYIHDFDPAILAAGLDSALAARHALSRCATRVAYFTSDTAVDDPLVASFRVVEVAPLSRKRLANWIREHNVGTLEIKCRGVDVRPEALRRELKPQGDASATLLIFPDHRGKPIVVIAERPL
ncbi:THUMP-like domain-containing protein [Botrimarina mediterranea]|uniref:THUMP-like domain-containing protein n=1 Tax=Botrimarina mediterranea TaxID=2528022 RepID=A0A518KBI4_9BACT|nr:hypothetical protein [Botrimarina mediterranea]QDV75152.1 hypothetical protein Spa11_33620 [Botrimarina mediterranea]QDV79798.1 hypothetical protein K2D_34140 [Planctomycetes bacterium K2D]